MRLTYEEAVERYGLIENGVWKEERQWMDFAFMPEGLKMFHAGHYGNKYKTVRKIYCNKDMKPALEQALRNIRDRGLAGELKTFGGCFNIRTVRGSDKLSTHSYGLAVDINSESNGLGQEPTMSAELVKCFTDEGFTWGGNFKRKDGMHFEYAWN